ncbi:nucleic acid-binding protein [Basidiobolus meristosporus CBS 931.73]|uniref:Nucleic acid-binding protein n=1 Tax=Basidiobolus meristosporus CBS 931.73 TaxID=1314790 RepID=A0A1Y1Z6I6_9FUNG|nr:nucleic acid-binding protein [Basidiobolus meristosporus CBS 931.73]|eukprot:ORY05861.1 nucleic acid-binding protein [Basidiobolus meristosporus CBS 931.73]
MDATKLLLSTSTRMDLVKTLHGGLVFDGEICVFKDSRNLEGNVENFQAIMREISRNEHQVQDPVYFVFDVLTHKEFLMKERSRLFSERLDFANQLFNDFDHPRMKLLEHTKVKDFTHLQQLKNVAFERRWEGLMLRNDTEYEGKRSRNLLKIKQWEDEEFIVEDIQKTKMNLAVRGTSEEREILGSVVIRYKGNKVNVGSGFTLDQRIRYAATPSLIIGKPITVQYYSETEPSVNRKASTPSSISLRFPTVKAVYESGARDT